MTKWARLVGPARQPAQKRVSQVGISNSSTCCNPARLTRQFSRPKRASLQAGLPTFFLCLKLKIIKKE